MDNLIDNGQWTIDNECRSERHCQLSTPYIDLHTHGCVPNTADRFSLPNAIVPDIGSLSQPCSLGIHPRHIREDSQSQEVLREHASRENVWAIGECGLDRLADCGFAVQEHLFREQICLAGELRKPLIVHCVRAHQECLHILREERARTAVVFHGFDKGIELAQQIHRDGHYISLGASLLNGKRDDLIRDFPLDGIFLETDGKPTAIADIYAYFCRVRKMDPEWLKERLHRNFMRVFNGQIKG